MLEAEEQLADKAMLLNQKQMQLGMLGQGSAKTHCIHLVATSRVFNIYFSVAKGLLRVVSVAVLTETCVFRPICSDQMPHCFLQLPFISTY